MNTFVIKTNTWHYKLASIGGLHRRVIRDKCSTLCDYIPKVINGARIVTFKTIGHFIVLALIAVCTTIMILLPIWQLVTGLCGYHTIWSVFEPGTENLYNIYLMVGVGFDTMILFMLSLVGIHLGYKHLTRVRYHDPIVQPCILMVAIKSWLGKFCVPITIENNNDKF